MTLRTGRLRDRLQFDCLITRLVPPIKQLSIAVHLHSTATRLYFYAPGVMKYWNKNDSWSRMSNSITPLNLHIEFLRIEVERRSDDIAPNSNWRRPQKGFEGSTSIFVILCIFVDRKTRYVVRLPTCSEQSDFGTHKEIRHQREMIAGPKA